MAVFAYAPATLCEYHCNAAESLVDAVMVVESSEAAVEAVNIENAVDGPWMAPNIGGDVG